MQTYGFVLMVHFYQRQPQGLTQQLICMVEVAMETHEPWQKVKPTAQRSNILS